MRIVAYSFPKLDRLPISCLVSSIKLVEVFIVLVYVSCANFKQYFKIKMKIKEISPTFYSFLMVHTLPQNHFCYNQKGILFLWFCIKASMLNFSAHTHRSYVDI